ncbi:MAG: hypothetical protein U9Q78_08200 [Chloroflexota bacterium]|nr:hypothetical protein [Chloroflexota bacterium]
MGGKLEILTATGLLSRREGFFTTNPVRGLTLAGVVDSGVLVDSSVAVGVRSTCIAPPMGVKVGVGVEVAVGGVTSEGVAVGFLVRRTDGGDETVAGGGGVAVGAEEQPTS